jgi:hypothetical protein
LLTTSRYLNSSCMPLKRTGTTHTQAVQLADGVTVARDGTVYFTDASVVQAGALRASDHTQYEMMDAVLETVLRGPSGRLLRYSPATGETTVDEGALVRQRGGLVRRRKLRGGHSLRVEQGASLLAAWAFGTRTSLALLHAPYPCNTLAHSPPLNVNACRRARMNSSRCYRAPQTASPSRLTEASGWRYT